MSKTISIWMCHPKAMPDDTKADYLLDDETFRQWLNEFPNLDRKPLSDSPKYDWTRMNVTVEVAQ